MRPFGQDRLCTSTYLWTPHDHQPLFHTGGQWEKAKKGEDKHVLVEVICLILHQLSSLGLKRESPITKGKPQSIWDCICLSVRCVINIIKLFFSVMLQTVRRKGDLKWIRGKHTHSSLVTGSAVHLPHVPATGATRDNSATQKERRRVEMVPGSSTSCLWTTLDCGFTSSTHMTSGCGAAQQEHG